MSNIFLLLILVGIFCFMPRDGKIILLCVIIFGIIFAFVECGKLMCH